MRTVTCLALTASIGALAGCGGTAGPSPLATALEGAAPIGTGPRYERPSLHARTRAGKPVGALTCRAGAAARRAAAWVHVELFGRRRVVLLPPGIGIAPPRERRGAYVRGGRCRYPVWTDEPTGLVAVARPGLRLRDLFRVWGQPLTRRGAAGFRGPVTVHVGGRRHRGHPGAVRLDHHAQIVVQVGGPLLPPHASYTFPEGR